MYQRILVPVDGSETAALGLAEAVRLGKVLGAKVRILHVVRDVALLASPEAAVYSDQLLHSAHVRGEAILQEAQRSARSLGLESDVKAVDGTGGPAGDAIVEEARHWPADLIVLGTHGRRGIRRLVLGSDAESIVRTSPVPVLLVRGPKSSTED